LNSQKWKEENQKLRRNSFSAAVDPDEFGDLSSDIYGGGGGGGGSGDGNESGERDKEKSYEDQGSIPHLFRRGMSSQSGEGDEEDSENVREEGSSCIGEFVGSVLAERCSDNSIVDVRKCWYLLNDRSQKGVRG